MEIVIKTKGELNEAEKAILQELIKQSLEALESHYLLPLPDVIEHHLNLLKDAKITFEVRA